MEENFKRRRQPHQLRSKQLAGVYQWCDRIDETRIKVLFPEDPRLQQTAEDAIRAALLDETAAGDIELQIRVALAGIGGLSYEQTRIAANALASRISRAHLQHGRRRVVDASIRWARRHRDSLFIAIVAVALLVAPWRFTERASGHITQQNAPYGLIFSPPHVPASFDTADIDTARYAAQVLSVAGICALIRARLRRRTTPYGGARRPLLSERTLDVFRPPRVMPPKHNEC